MAREMINSKINSASARLRKPKARNNTVMKIIEK